MGKNLKALLKDLAAAGDQHGAVVKKAKPRELESLVRQGYVEPGTFKVTEKGLEYVGKPAVNAPATETEDETEETDTAFTPEQESAIGKSVDAAIGTAIEKFPPLA